MKKKDKLKLDSISNIDEKLIDEATDLRISLSERVRRAAAAKRKRIISIACAAACFVFVFALFAALIGPIIGLGNTVPVYQGMTIRQSSVRNVAKDPIFGDFVPLGGTNNGNGNAYGHDKKEDKLDKKIEDIVNIDILTDDEVKYYVKPGETFIIEVHISNPDNYEIQSFTLNGKKYANYMFKEGSTMELLLLEVTAPETSGYVEYTIDAIKYIDGTEIKDVDMSGGNKSIKAGIAYPTAPSAALTSKEISTTSVTLNINVFDPCSVIGDNELAVYLSDGENIVSSVPLELGSNTITFDGLKMATLYEYGVVAVFDMADKRDLHEEWLLTEEFTTLGAYGIENVVMTQTSVSFEASKSGENGTITSVSLYDAATQELIEALSPDAREFKNLLSNHTYNLYIDYTYTLNGEEINNFATVEIKTAAKTAPTLTFGETSSDKTSVTYAVDVIDTDNLLNVQKVEILLGESSVKDNGKALTGTFDSLLSSNKYTIKVTYSYDLNDGAGVHTGTIVKKDIITLSKTEPTLRLENMTSTQTSVSFGTNIKDPDNILCIERIELYCEEMLVSIAQSIDARAFENLLSKTLYTVKITYSYDLNDGNNAIIKTVERKARTAAKTTPRVKIENMISTQTSVGFEISTTDVDNILSIDKIELYLGETLAKTAENSSARTFEGLLSNNNYTVKVTYKYDLNDGAGVHTKTALKEITTVAKTAPTISFSDIDITDVKITGTINMADPDAIGTITSVDIYKGDQKVTSNTAREFDFAGLEYYTKYQIRVSYSYDLNDGAGVHNDTATYDFNTAPHLEFKNFDIINTSAVSEGETIFLQVNIENPNNVVYKKIIVNGAEYDVVKNSSSTTMLVCEIVNNGQFEGGDTTLTIEKIIADIEGIIYTIEPQSNNTSSVFINGKLHIENAGVAILKDGEYVDTNYIFPSDTSYIKIKFFNKTGYTIDSITINGNIHNEFIKINDENYLIEYYFSGGPQTFTITAVEYSKNTFKNTVTDQISSGIICLDSDDIHFISTPEDLLNMNSGMYYYELANDIDLSEYGEWIGGSFSGVFNGKGYSIKNMSYVGTITNSSAHLGLFSGSADGGVIENLNLESVRFIVKHTSDLNAIPINFGGIISWTSGPFFAISNCSVDASSFINIDGSYVGGIIGYTYSTICTITNCTNNATINGNSDVGGIIGGAHGDANSTETSFVSILNCQNSGNVTGSVSSTYGQLNYNVGGILGGSYAIITNCINNAMITGEACVGGIAGTNEAILNHCENNGNVTGYSYVGGIVGNSYYATFTNCSNNAIISGTGHYVGGIAGHSAGTISNCANNATILGNVMYMGGIAGLNYGNISNCSNNAIISGTGSNVGGISVNRGIVTNCYSLGENATAEQLNSKSFYTDTLGWSEDIWNLDDLDVENGKYPTLH